jgi:hypothetical protein
MHQARVNAKKDQVENKTIGYRKPTDLYFRQNDRRGRRISYELARQPPTVAQAIVLPAVQRVGVALDNLQAHASR